MSVVMSLRALVVRAVGLSLVLTIPVIGIASAPAAQADTAPDDGTPATVSADGLPTWQVNGVVWSQAIAGNTVFAGGKFTAARPPGVAVGGAGSVAANNFFAYDITTGNRVAAFSHSMNGQVLAVNASPDGSRVYVGGDFTTVDGVARNHIVAFDTTTGAVVHHFKPSISAPGARHHRDEQHGLRRRQLLQRERPGTHVVSPPSTPPTAAHPSMGADGRRRTRSRPWWCPRTGPGDRRRQLHHDQRCICKWHGLGRCGHRCQPAVGSQPDGMRDGGAGSRASPACKTDGSNIYGSGYAFGTGQFEGAFAAAPNTGDIIWANDCHGDTYDVMPTRAGRLHASAMRTTASRSVASSRATRGRSTCVTRWHSRPTQTGMNNGIDDYGWDYRAFLPPRCCSGTRRWPSAPARDRTRRPGHQPATASTSRWAVSSRASTGLPSRAWSGSPRNDIAPNKRGPVRAPNAPTPTADSLSAGTARVGWQAPYDMDNEELTYSVTRSGTAAPVYTTTAKSNFWKYPGMGFIDTGPDAGRQLHLHDQGRPIRPATAMSLPKTNAVTISATAASQYSKDVIADGATRLLATR